MKNGPYELIVAPEDFPGKRYRGRYAYEHTVVWWQHTGELPGSDETIHHKNENKRDNRFDNLEKKTRVEHSREHQVLADRVELTCKGCGRTFMRLLSRVRESERLGKGGPFCGRSCAGRATGPLARK